MLVFLYFIMAVFRLKRMVYNVKLLDKFTDQKLLQILFFYL
jgi:hypothetical protein